MGMEPRCLGAALGGQPGPLVWAPQIPENDDPLKCDVQEGGPWPSARNPEENKQTKPWTGSNSAMRARPTCVVESNKGHLAKHAISRLEPTLQLTLQQRRHTCCAGVQALAKSSSKPGISQHASRQPRSQFSISFACARTVCPTCTLQRRTPRRELTGAIGRE